MMTKAQPPTKHFKTQLAQEAIGVYTSEDQGNQASRLASIRPIAKKDQYPSD